LEHSFRIADEFVHRDLNDHNSRGGLAMAGISLGGILRRSDASRALEVYDHTLRHLAETPGDEHLQRLEITLLAGSSYALRSLGRMADARHRLDAALQRLRQLKMYPADTIDPGSAVEETLQAVAMDEAAGNHLAAAIAQYQELLDHIPPANSEPSLEDAVRLSTIYTSAAGLYLRAGDPLRASELTARRMELWRAWERKLPNNPFVLRQIAARSVN
jgi:tetratricopeptide (TPR) repeat protein